MVIYIICYPLVNCLVAPANCGAIADCLRILVASSLPCHHRIVVASPLPRRCIVPPFAHHHHHHVHPCCPTRTATATAIAIGIIDRYPHRCCCHHRCHSSCRRFFASIASVQMCPSRWMLWRYATPAIICDGPDGRTTKTCYGTA